MIQIAPEELVLIVSNRIMNGVGGTLGISRGEAEAVAKFLIETGLVTIPTVFGIDPIATNSDGGTILP